MECAYYIKVICLAIIWRVLNKMSVYYEYTMQKWHSACIYFMLVCSVSRLNVLIFFYGTIFIFQTDETNVVQDNFFLRK